MNRRIFCQAGALGALAPDALAAGVKERRLLYVASPGIRNYVEHGGLGILVYDADAGHRFSRRIPTFEETAGEPEAIKGIAASAATGKLYLTTPARLLSLDLRSERVDWVKPLDGGCDRLAIAPDGKVLYVPSYEGPHWHAVDALAGTVIRRVETKSGSHNTIFGPSGRRVYLAGLKSPELFIADARTHAVVARTGPFAAAIRPFTINGDESLCFVNVNGLLGFEIGDLRTGKKLHRVEIRGFAQGPTKRHGCPSHGIALSPDESTLWVTDAANSRLHVFDARALPPRQVATVELRDQPGWVSFSLDGRLVYSSTGDIIDAATMKVVRTLADETGHPVQSEKLLEIAFAGDKPTRAGNQFGIGQKRR